MEKIVVMTFSDLEKLFAKIAGGPKKSGKATPPDEEDDFDAEEPEEDETDVSDEEETEDVTAKTINEKIAELVKKGKKEKIRALFKIFKATAVSNLKEAKYSAFYDKLNAIK